MQVTLLDKDGKPFESLHIESTYSAPLTFIKPIYPTSPVSANDPIQYEYEEYTLEKWILPSKHEPIVMMWYGVLKGCKLPTEFPGFVPPKITGSKGGDKKFSWSMYVNSRSENETEIDPFGLVEED